MRKERDILPVIKYVVLFLLAVCLPLVLGYTVYTRSQQQVIDGIYIGEFDAKNFTIRVQDKNDKHLEYVVDYGLATIYDRNGQVVQVRKNLFENDPTTGWGVGNHLRIRIEKRGEDGIYQANQIIDYSLPTPNLANSFLTSVCSIRCNKNPVL